MVTTTATEPHTTDHDVLQTWELVAQITDPELPVITIEDLGILRSVRVNGTDVTVQITPTYSGCPALEAISDDVRRALTEAGFDHVTVDVVLAPAWTTDWITEHGKDELRRFGIAPPSGRATAGRATAARGGPVRMTLSVKCPQCDSLHTRELSHFGSTSCKALYECLDCGEPFDYFKVL